MKKILCCLLILIALVTLTGCNKGTYLPVETVETDGNGWYNGN